MFKPKDLESLIRDHIHFRPISTGWEVGKCQMCNDYKERAGIKYDSGEIAYNCWNCGTSARYTEFSGKISNKFTKILASYGIDVDEINAIVNSSFFTEDQEQKTITLSSLTKPNLDTPTIKLPKASLRLGSTLDFLDYQEKIAKYLVDRKVDLLKYAFFFSIEDRFIDRVIIPFYRNGKLIYWQARSIDKNEKKRHDNAPVSREAIMFNYDKVFTVSSTPLVVCEGVFDAMMLDGIAILGSKLTAAKIEILKQSRRKLVFIIDKDENGKHLAEEVLSHGWEICFTPEGSHDLNDSVQKYGFSESARYIAENKTKNKDIAKMLINLNCK